MKVICAGMRRSASTWLYNVVRLGLSSPGCFEDNYSKLRHNPKLSVLKTHRYDERWLFGADVVLTCHRDLRDVVASAVRRKLIYLDSMACLRYALRAHDEHEPWSGRAALDLRYETIVGNKTAAATEVLAAIGSDMDPAQIAQQVESLRLPERGMDPESLLWPMHFTDGKPGAWRQTLDPRTGELLTMVFRDWLMAKGYSP